MAIDLAQVGRQVLERSQSRLADQAPHGAGIGPGQGAARFEELMEAPDAPAGTPTDGGVARAAFDRTPPSAPAGEVDDVPPRASTVGDRILANLPRSAVRSPAEAGQPVVGPPTGNPPVDIARPMESLELQIEVARIKETIGLAVSATQKSSQGVDTLLKSQ